MAREPKPWYRKDRDAWFVSIDGKRHKLGTNKKAAFEKFYSLMNNQPETTAGPEQKSLQANAQGLQFIVIADLFLEWSQLHRSPDTYEWYRYRLERFCRRYPNLTFDQLKPHHVQQWVDSYPVRKSHLYFLHTTLAGFTYDLCTINEPESLERLLTAGDDVGTDAGSGQTKLLNSRKSLQYFSYQNGLQQFVFG